MQEREIGRPESQNHDGWMPLEIIPSLDYWAGFSYRGLYSSRMEVDMPRFESICRKLNLPQVTVKSSAWNPPSVMEPEMVAPGLSAFKKSVLRIPKSSGDIQIDHKLMMIKPMESPVLEGIPIGWEILVKDRKIEHDYTRKHPLAKREEIEANFLRFFNHQLVRSLMRIAISDYHGARDRLSVRLAEDLRGIIWTGVAMNWGVDSFSYVYRMFGNEILAGSAGYAINGGIQVWGRESTKKLVIKKRINTNLTSHMITDDWRKTTFPHRYYDEPDGMEASGEGIIGFLPFSFFLDPFYRDFAILPEFAKPLIRLRAKN